MPYKLLGRSGLRVSELALGTMTFGPDWGWGADKDESKAMFDAFADAGGTFIDTANRYTDGTSERFVGEFVGGDRGHFVVSSKNTVAAARDVGASATTQVALSWVRWQSPTMIPLVGARKADQLVDIGCVEVVLGAGELARLDAVSAIERGFPYDFTTGGRESFMGKITDQVDDHRHTAV